MRTTFLQVGAVLIVVGAVVSLIGYGAFRGWFPLPLSHDRRTYLNAMRRLFPKTFRSCDEDFQISERGYQILILMIGLMLLLIAVLLLACGVFVNNEPHRASFSLASKISVSVSSQPMQPSVIETP